MSNVDLTALPDNLESAYNNYLSAVNDVNNGIRAGKSEAQLNTLLGNVKAKRNIALGIVNNGIDYNSFMSTSKTAFAVTEVAQNLNGGNNDLGASGDTAKYAVNTYITNENNNDAVTARYTGQAEAWANTKEGKAQIALNTAQGNYDTAKANLQTAMDGNYTTERVNGKGGLLSLFEAAKVALIGAGGNVAGFYQTLVDRANSYAHTPEQTPGNLELTPEQKAQVFLNKAKDGSGVSDSEYDAALAGIQGTKGLEDKQGLIDKLNKARALTIVNGITADTSDATIRNKLSALSGLGYGEGSNLYDQALAQIGDGSGTGTGGKGGKGTSDRAQTRDFTGGKGEPSQNGSPLVSTTVSIKEASEASQRILAGEGTVSNADVQTIRGLTSDQVATIAGNGDTNIQELHSIATSIGDSDATVAQGSTQVGSVTIDKNSDTNMSQASNYSFDYNSQTVTTAAAATDDVAAAFRAKLGDAAAAKLFAMANDLNAGVDIGAKYGITSSDPLYTELHNLQVANETAAADASPQQALADKIKLAGAGSVSGIPQTAQEQALAAQITAHNQQQETNTGSSQPSGSGGISTDSVNATSLAAGVNIYTPQGADEQNRIMASQGLGWYADANGGSGGWVPLR